MAEQANQLNVPSDSPTEKYRTPNENPNFITTSKDVSTGGGGNVVNNGNDVTFGGTGKPVSN
jgi:hypothetical protein